MAQFKPHNSRTNPISLRVWYPRLVDDESFDRLLDNLRYIRAERVYLFDNSYMDNYQLSPQVLAERRPVLTRRIARLKQEGIVAGINSGATIGHGIRPDNSERQMELDWWVGSDGKTLEGIACPLDERFRIWLEQYFRGLAETGAQEIFIDDDLRLGCHGGPRPSEFGCLCDRHIAKMEEDFGHKLSREQLVEVIGTLSPGRVQEDWFSLWKQDCLDLLRIMERAVHQVNPAIRLGLMPVQNFIRAFGEDFLRDAIELVSKGNRPLLRTHDYHGLPHEMVPGSGLAAKRAAPADAEHVVEIENISHNCHEYVRSPKTTRYAILSALALGMGGAAVTFGDSERDMPWEQRYVDMLRESDPFFRTVAELTKTDTVMRGVPVRNRAYQRRVTCIDTMDNIFAAASDEQPDVIAGVFGFAYRFHESQPALLLGRLPYAMDPDELRLTLSRGAVIDVVALRCLKDLGFGPELGVEIGELMSCHRGQRFLDHPFNKDYAGDIVALRGNFPAYHLEADSSEYTEVTEFVTWSGRRLAGGVLLQSEGKSRNVILPHILSINPPYYGLVNTQFRSLLKQLLSYVLCESLTLSVDGPTNIRPYYFERQTDGAVIITLLNAYYDDLYGFDLVLGDGERLMPKQVYRVTSAGSIERAGLSIRRAEDGSYRLRIDEENALRNCDVSVFIIE